MNTQNDYITLNEVCMLLNIGHNTAYKLVKENKIKNFKIGRRYKIRRQDVEDFISKQEHH